MFSKWFVTLFVINVVSCLRSIQKTPPKYNTAPSNPDPVSLTVPSDKNSFPDVVYPTSILDMPNPFYFNTDNNDEVLGPFSEDVKSSYKLLSLITKPVTRNSTGSAKNQTKINEIVTTPVSDAVMNVLIKENITLGYHNNIKEMCVDFEVIKTKNNTDSLLDNTLQNNYIYNLSLPLEVQNESCSKIPLLVKINIQVSKQRYVESREEKVIGIANNSRSQHDEENTTHLKQVTDTSYNESNEENSSSEEHYTELQDIKHSDFIKMLSDLLSDSLASTDNTTSDILNTTLIENESLERIALESIDNLSYSDGFGSMEPNVTDLIVNITHSDIEHLLNLTEPFRHNDGESSKDSKEDYFLELLVSLDSLGENNKTIETVEDSDYLTNHEKLLVKNFTVI